MSLAARLVRRVAGGGAAPRDGGVLTAWRFARDGDAAEIVEIESVEGPLIQRTASAAPDGRRLASPPGTAQGTAPMPVAPITGEAEFKESGVKSSGFHAEPSRSDAFDTRPLSSAMIDGRAGAPPPFDPSITTTAPPTAAAIGASGPSADSTALPRTPDAAVAADTTATAITASDEAVTAASAAASMISVTAPPQDAGDAPNPFANGPWAASESTEVPSATALSPPPPAFDNPRLSGPPRSDNRFAEPPNARPRIVVEAVDVYVAAPPPVPVRAETAIARARIGARYLSGL